MWNWPNYFILKWVYHSQKHKVEKVGAEGITSVERPSVSILEVVASVLAFLDGPNVALFVAQANLVYGHKGF